MDFRLPKYPFTEEAGAYIGGLGHSLDAIITSQGDFYEKVRQRAKNRIIQSILGGIERPVFPQAKDDADATRRLIEKDYGEAAEIELLSYPIARLMLTCIGEGFLTRRYALQEAKAASRDLQNEPISFLLHVAKGFGIDAREVDDEIELHFTDYLGPSSGMRDPKWKLVNRPLREGWVTISKGDFARLLEEKIRRHVLDIPGKVDPSLCESLQPLLDEIEAVLEEARGDLTEDLGKAEPGAFPPCIMYMVEQIRQGTNLAHSARFALTSFLTHIGMSVDDVVGVFGESPDFDEERTRYQVEHISGVHGGTQYTPPTCTTMNTYGNCYGKDDLCRRINHPLSYYRIKKKSGDGKASGTS